TPSGFVVAGDTFVEDSWESGGWTLGLDAAGGLDPSCAIIHPLALTLSDPGFTASAASEVPVGFVVTSSATNVVAGTVTSHVARLCSAIECSPPHATIASITPLP